MFGRRETWERGPLSAVDIFSVDGGVVDGVNVSNIVVYDAYAAFFVRLGSRGGAQRNPVPGKIRNVSIANISASRTAMTSAIVGVPGHFPENIFLNNINVSVSGKRDAKPISLAVPERTAEYPDVDMFGSLPAYGLYLRHVRNVSISGLRLSLERADSRPAVVADDAEELEVFGVRAAPSDGASPVLMFRDVQHVLIQGARAVAGTKAFLKLSGSRTEKVHAIGNDLSEAAEAFIVDTEVPVAALAQSGNLLGGT